jgi:hypothetical protein
MIFIVNLPSDPMLATADGGHFALRRACLQRLPAPPQR